MLFAAAAAVATATTTAAVTATAAFTAAVGALLGLLIRALLLLLRLLIRALLLRLLVAALLLGLFVGASLLLGLLVGALAGSLASRLPFIATRLREYILKEATPTPGFLLLWLRRGLWLRLPSLGLHIGVAPLATVVVAGSLALVGQGIHLLTASGGRLVHVAVLRLVGPVHAAGLVVRF
jgi:hypothetical protein